jgi:hypothetical protein
MTSVTWVRHRNGAKDLGEAKTIHLKQGAGEMWTLLLKSVGLLYHALTDF